MGTLKVRGAKNVPATFKNKFLLSFLSTSFFLRGKGGGSCAAPAFSVRVDNVLDFSDRKRKDFCFFLLYCCSA